MNSLDPCEKREMCMNDCSTRACGALASLQVNTNSLLVQLEALSIQFNFLQASFFGRIRVQAHFLCSGVTKLIVLCQVN